MNTYPDWIRADEHLPGNGAQVLAYTTGQGIGLAWHWDGVFEDGNEFRGYANPKDHSRLRAPLDYYRVTHWMPCPEEPK